MAYLWTFLVGAVFLASGLLKAVDAGSFMRHVFRYRILPIRLLLPAALGLIGLECALGVALMAHAFPTWLVPGTIGLLLGFCGLTLWGTSSGRVEDCGCYGGLLAVTPLHSVLLNLSYGVLLGLAWLFPVADAHTALWQALLPLVALVGGSGLAWRSGAGPLVDLSRLQTGRRWRPGWLRSAEHTLAQGAHFVVFLSQDCPYCKMWVPLMNIMHTQPEMPAVLGIMDLPPAQREAFSAQHLVRFPVVQIDRLRLRTLVDGFPTAALVEHGMITQKWVGELPPEYVKRIQAFLESVYSLGGGSKQARPFGG